jgi:hypothetical protein
VLLLALSIAPAYVAGAFMWRLGFGYVPFGCLLLSLLLGAGLWRLRPFAFDAMAAVLTASSLLSLMLFYRTFDGGGDEQFSMGQRIALAILWIFVSLGLARLSALFARRIRAIEQPETR